MAHRIEQITQGMFHPTPGSLFPSLHRLERDGWLESRWGRSQNNRRAKYYQLTRAGHRHLEQATGAWRRIVVAMNAALQAT